METPVTDRYQKLNSHTYSASTFEVTENGLQETETPLLIKFCKGSTSKENPKQTGILTEQLLKIVKLYLEEVNVGNLQTTETNDAIEYIQKAIDKLAERSRDRKKRNVINTYKK